MKIVFVFSWMCTEILEGFLGPLGADVTGAGAGKEALTGSCVCPILNMIGCLSTPLLHSAGFKERKIPRHRCVFSSGRWKIGGRYSERDRLKSLGTQELKRCE